MSIHCIEDLQGLLTIGSIVSETLAALVQRTQPGMTTAELDAACARILDSYGARSTPRFLYGFPGHACISVNDEVVHGIPGPRVIRPGDLVKIDLTADRDGYIADATRMVLMPPVKDLVRRLAACARSAFGEAVKAATAGNLVRDIGRVVDLEVRRYGFSVIRELTGHGVGQRIHEPPSIPNYDEPRSHEPLTEGLVITIEPIIAAGSPAISEAEDGWTISTIDGSLSAHFEQTIMITDNEPVILTA